MKLNNILPRFGAALLVTVFLNGSLLAMFNYAAVQGSAQSAADIAGQV